MNAKWIYFEELGCYYSFNGSELMFCPSKSDRTPAVNDAIRTEQISEFAYSVLNKHFPKEAFDGIDIKFSDSKPHDME